MQDLLLISDLHLGSHLKPRMRGEWVHLAGRIEESFPRFMEHYRRHGRWQLVINGDFIDFWNIELPHEKGESGERLAIRRLHTVLDAHPAVEDALARFLAAGHGIVFVAGNHDAELLYPGVRAALAARLERAMGKGREHDDGHERVGLVRLGELEPGRVRFVRWFLHEQGGVWIEHGHKFDASCATPASMSPTRRGRLVQTVAEVATRSFTNVMPEIDYDAPDRFSTMDYVRWALARGFRFVLRVMILYLRMTGRIIALWAGPGRVDGHGKKMHAELLAAVAANAGLQMSALMALEKMAPPPSATTVAGLIKITALDHVLAVTVPITVAVIGTVRGHWSWLVGIAVAMLVTVLWLAVVRRGRKRRDVGHDMATVAAEVGKLTDVPLVLMGHSHRGTIERFGDVVYANSGSWLDGSHLVVHRDRGSGRLRRVELRSWRNGGIMRIASTEVPEPARVADVSEVRTRSSDVVEPELERATAMSGS